MAHNLWRKPTLKTNSRKLATSCNLQHDNRKNHTSGFTKAALVLSTSRFWDSNLFFGSFEYPARARHPPCTNCDLICVGGVDYMKQKRLNNVFWQENERNRWRYRRRVQIFSENLGRFDWLLGFLEPGWDKDCCVDIQLLFWNLGNILRSRLTRICWHLLHFFQHLK